MNDVSTQADNCWRFTVLAQNTTQCVQTTFKVLINLGKFYVFFYISSPNLPDDLIWPNDTSTDDVTTDDVPKNGFCEKSQTLTI